MVRGVFEWPDGRSYKGQFLKGQQDGTGLLTNAKGLARHGEWSAAFSSGQTAEVTRGSSSRDSRMA